jgi:glycosyltransferase involved in cell wall biosynthesis
MPPFNQRKPREESPSQHRIGNPVTKELKIDIITGSYPPMRCGVGDYTYQLSKAVRNKQVEVDVFTSISARLHNRHLFLHPVVKKWGMLKMLSLARTVRISSPRLVHIQYPTIDYGYHLGPQALLILLRLSGLKVVSTIHEFQLARIPRRISLLPFLAWSNALIFTSEEERTAVIDAFPWLRNKIRDSSHVIPVGSNIPLLSNTTVSKEANHIVSFFGLFYPGRRIELVVNAFNEARKKHPKLKFRFIGDVHPRHKGYFLKIKEIAEEMLPQKRVEWILGRTPEEIALALKQSDACVLPFPDGASFRRTTFIAALSLGIPTITTKGKSTPEQLIDGMNVLFADDDSSIATMIDRLLTDHTLSAKLSENAKILSNRFSWDQIAKEHIKVYEKLGSECVPQDSLFSIR